MSETPNHAICTIDGGRLRAMWRAVEYVARGSHRAPDHEYSCVHVSVIGQTLHLLATDGITAAWATEPVEAGDCDSIGVNVKMLGDELTEIGRVYKNAPVTLSRIDDHLVLEVAADRPATDNIVHAHTWRLPLNSRWMSWRWLIEPRIDAASASVVTADLVGALPDARSRKDGAAVAIDYVPGTEAARAWIEVQEKTVVTMADYTGSSAYWHSVATLGPATSERAEPLRIGVQIELLERALRHSGKRAVLHMYDRWPSSHGGIRIDGDNGSTHVICPMALKGER